MGGGLAFLTKKSFNPANWSNQRQVWEARQKNETEKRRLVERESQIKREREEEELARVVGGEEEGGRKALGFMYEAGKVPGLDRKSNSQNDDDGIGGVDGGMVSSSGQEGVGESLFERQPGDDDAAAAFRAMLARGAAADEPAPQEAAAAAQAAAQEGDSAEGKEEEDEKRPWENDHRTNLEKAVGRGINAGSGVTLAQQMERFPMLKGAPMVLQKPQGGGDSKKEGSAVNVAGLNFKPLGQVLRNIQCLKCGKWGHSRGDRECEMGWNPFASTAPPPVMAAPTPAAMDAAAESKPAAVKAPPEETMINQKSDRKHKKEKRRRKEDRHRKKKRKHKRRRRSYSSDSSSYDSRDRHYKRRPDDRDEESEEDSRDGRRDKRRHKKSSRRHKNEKRRHSRSRSRSRSE